MSFLKQFLRSIINEFVGQIKSHVGFVLQNVLFSGFCVFKLIKAYIIAVGLVCLAFKIYRI